MIYLTLIEPGLCLKIWSGEYGSHGVPFHRWASLVGCPNRELRGECIWWGWVSDEECAEAWLNCYQIQSVLLALEGF
jgi:hypothetical protein